MITTAALHPQVEPFGEMNFSEKVSSASCSEPHHTKGSSTKPCRICSTPVCDGCIVKASFAKEEVTLHMCRAYSCIECWISRKPLQGRRPAGPLDEDNDTFCICSTQDKWLCLQCKHTRRRFSESHIIQCEGRECSTIMESACYGGITCLLCGLETRPGREISQREYDSIHLSARFFTAFDPDASESESGETGPQAESSLQPGVVSNIAPSPEPCQTSRTSEIPRRKGGQTGRVEMLQVHSAADYGASRLETGQTARVDLEEKTSEFDRSNEKGSPEYLGPHRPKAGRRRVLRSVWKRANTLRSTLRILHSPKAFFQGYSRL